MRIARFKFNEIEEYGLIDGNKIKAIEGLPWGERKLSGKEYSLDEVKLLAPVLPPDIFAIGLNYRAHADEGGQAHPSAPVIFLKATSSLIGPEDCIKIPAMAPDEVDYEAELAIVIGRTCHKVSESDAFDCVLGYTCGNDVSARDAQLKQDKQWARGKSFDTFCPLGPWIETDIDPDNQEISLILNGKTMQSSNTSDMIFSCRKLVSYLSHVATLRPGTVIMTGTPSGVGFAKTPQVFLKAGDKVEVKISGIGSLINCVKNE